ncbi:trypsin-like isoform X2 [Hermetia illucens]|uniref:trypsin-like isoform X2 n=1 Tax=Hermetia illucens TaxID=343691 RepID=UPI0018CC5BE9|nr:trypsin-like isoform X2 [Hermetia illucens]
MMERNSCILLMLCSFAFLDKNSVGAQKTRLINATLSQLSYFPCMVQIVKKNDEHVCGGCILDDENVITAARCVKPFRQNWSGTELKVRGGDVILQNSKLPTFQVRNVRKFVVHPDFNEKTLENDVALLKISDPFMPAPNLHEAQKGLSTPRGRCFLPGWQNNKEKIGILHFATVYVTSASKCSRTVKKTICAESKTRQGMCEIDYGGPLICGTQLYGVFIGPPDACKGKPALFTDLSDFDNWLEKNTYRMALDKKSLLRSAAGADSILGGQMNLIVILPLCALKLLSR